MSIEFKHIRTLWKWINHIDVHNYIGKDFEHGKAQSYLKRVNREQLNFKLKQFKKDKYVYRWDNVKSKHKSSKRYKVLMSHLQIFLYDAAHKKMHDDNVKINEEEMHWYNHLKQEQEEKKLVSHFLSEKYQNMQKVLEEKRQKRMKRRRKYYYKNLNIGIMKKEDLLYFAQEHNIVIAKPSIKKEKIVQYVINELKKKKSKEWKEQFEVCCIEKCKMKPTGVCNNCKAVYFCDIHRNEKTLRKHWKEKHSKDCNRLKNTNYVEKTQQDIEDSIGLFESLDNINKLGKGAEIPDSLKYMKKYPINQKSWYDLNFRLFNSKLSRLQQRFSCRSGVQLPGCCCHVGCILWLIYYILFSNVDVILKKSKRDLKIWDNICDLTNFSKMQKNLRNKKKHWCAVCRDVKDDENFIYCDKCGRWYHFSCVDTKEEDVHSDLFTDVTFHCKFCSVWDVWVVRNC